MRIVETRPRPVRTMIASYSPHCDAWIGMDLSARFGRKVWPGIENADISFWDAGPFTPDGRSPFDWEAGGCQLYGVGGGRLHEAISTPEGQPTYCTASLTAIALGVLNRPELADILEWTRNNDRRAKRSPMDLAALNRAMNLLGLPADRQFKWWQRVMSALINLKRRQLARERIDHVIWDVRYNRLLCDWLLGHFPSQVKKVGEGRRVIEGAMDLADAMGITGVEDIGPMLDYASARVDPDPKKILFDFRTIVGALALDGASAKEMKRIAWCGFDALRFQQQRYMDATRSLYDHPPKLISIDTFAGLSPITIAHIVSDNSEMVSAVRTQCTPHIIVRRHSNGHASIHGHGIKIGPVVFRVRSAEMDALGIGGERDPMRLTQAGALPELCHMMFMQKQNCLVVGGTSAPGVRGLAQKYLLDHVESGVRWWLAKHPDQARMYLTSNRNPRRIRQKRAENDDANIRDLNTEL